MPVGFINPTGEWGGFSLLQTSSKSRSQLNHWSDHWNVLLSPTWQITCKKKERKKKEKERYISESTSKQKVIIDEKKKKTEKKHPRGACRISRAIPEIGGEGRRSTGNYNQTNLKKKDVTCRFVTSLYFSVASRSCQVPNQHSLPFLFESFELSFGIFHRSFDKIESIPCSPPSTLLAQRWTEYYLRF